MSDATDGLYLGLISGTSLDGIDAALIERAGDDVRLIQAATSPYPEVLRDALRRIAGGNGDVVSLYRCDLAVGDVFATAASSLLEASDTAPSAVRAIGSHGQTVWHQPREHFSVQIGDGARIALHTGITTICDFRRADLAAGGEGAPLAPIFHRATLAGSDPRAVLNLGGIANLTLLRPGNEVRAFDVGPGNTLLDALARERLGTPFDRDGKWAAGGNADPALLEALLADPWFTTPPPKSTGPEYFHLDWVRRRPRARVLAAPDLAATLGALTARSVAHALADFGPGTRRMYVCGGGVHNSALMRGLQAEMPDVEVASTSAAGVDPDFVEAMCFAWLAGETLAGRPGNLPDVTGASRAAVLGAIHQP